ncbi:hypothetical protein Vau01_117050 [Virgisporangium aurantiacum]|uniref:Uncharacterized protein n=1 Tax=Virgisporangium aurantiacum TaxID=175570 RepID=A0A8J3ZHB6_9ACTN|nr:hypothetical protein Vau01_117050 [Virgisporangium aurantiacum]
MYTVVEQCGGRFGVAEVSMRAMASHRCSSASDGPAEQSSSPTRRHEAASRFDRGPWTEDGHPDVEVAVVCSRKAMAGAP